LANSSVVNGGEKVEISSVASSWFVSCSASTAPDEVGMRPLSSYLANTTSISGSEKPQLHVRKKKKSELGYLFFFLKNY
jgi:hypothetical protein